MEGAGRTMREKREIACESTKDEKEGMMSCMCSLFYKNKYIIAHFKDIKVEFEYLDF